MSFLPQCKAGSRSKGLGHGGKGNRSKGSLLWGFGHCAKRSMETIVKGRTSRALGITREGKEFLWWGLGQGKKKESLGTAHMVMGRRKSK